MPIPLRHPLDSVPEADRPPGPAAPAQPEGAPVVGWVNGAPVSEPDLRCYQQALAASPAGVRLGLMGPLGRRAGDDGGARSDALRTWAVRALLLDTLAEKEAARLGLSGPGAAPDDWADGLELAGELKFEAPSDDDAFACYQANMYRWRFPAARRARHLLVADEGVAQRLAATVGGPSDVAVLARRVSLDMGTRHRGGDLGWVERGQLAGELEKAIFDAVPGRVVGPVRTVFGWHLVIVEEERSAGLRPFAACRAQILAELSEDRRRGAWREWWERRVAESIEVPPGSEAVLSPGLPGTTHRH